MAFIYQKASVIPEFLIKALHHLPMRCTSNHVLHKRGTIFALSSGHGKAGVAVIRLSGPSSGDAVKLLGKTKKMPEPRQAVLRRFCDPVTTEAIDRGLVLWFPAPYSFTGEDCAEFHIHGGQAVISAMLTALGSLPGLRHAEAGEFTKRAFMNGKLDLTEVEGLADLINAETETQRKQALRQMEGDLSRLYLEWRRKLLKCLANVEAYIDFSEDENIEDDVLDLVSIQVKYLLEAINLHLNDRRQGERLRSGVHIVIIGQPNVGKSSLLNAVCHRPAAIVSPVAGTTRDVVETALNISGYPVLLSDTAGLRESQDEVEQEGIRRAIIRALHADIKILILEAPYYKKHNQGRSLHEFVSAHLKELGLYSDDTEESMQPSGHQEHRSMSTPDSDQHSQMAKDLKDTVIVFNKCDLLPDYDKDILYSEEDDLPASFISCRTGDGITEFLEKLSQSIKFMCGNPLAGSPSLTQVRHRTHLLLCVRYLESYQTKAQGDDIVLAAQELQKAMRELGKITGKVSSEDILDVIFKDFCIGK